MISEPLSLLDCSPLTDGGAAIILCREDLAKKYCDTPIYITGTGQASDTLALHDRGSLTGLKAAVDSSKVAYKMAGVGAKDIDVCEVHDCFTIAEIMATEDLGFCKKGEGGKFAEEGNTKIGGKIR